jgi:hypothetical protein
MEAIMIETILIFGCLFIGASITGWWISKSAFSDGNEKVNNNCVLETGANCTINA